MLTGVDVKKNRMYVSFPFSKEEHSVSEMLATTGITSFLIRGSKVVLNIITSDDVSNLLVGLVNSLIFEHGFPAPFLSKQLAVKVNNSTLYDYYTLLNTYFSLNTLAALEIKKIITPITGVYSSGI